MTHNFIIELLNLSSIAFVCRSLNNWLFKSILLKIPSQAPNVYDFSDTLEG